MTKKKEKQAIEAAVKTDQPVHLRFPLELHNKVKEYAKEETRTFSNAVIALVKEGLTNN